MHASLLAPLHSLRTEVRLRAAGRAGGGFSPHSPGDWPDTDVPFRPCLERFTEPDDLFIYVHKAGGRKRDGTGVQIFQYLNMII